MLNLIMNSPCSHCNSSKAPLSCGICQASMCKSCAHFADEDSVIYLDIKPEYFSHGVFCQNCFEQEVEPVIAAHNEILEKAEQVHIFYKAQSKESRFVRRHEKPIRVKDCVDHDFTVMKLAFVTAKMGFNILVDVETFSEKVRNGGWQTSNWNGVGIPGRVDENKMNRRFVGTPN